MACIMPAVIARTYGPRTHHVDSRDHTFSWNERWRPGPQLNQWCDCGRKRWTQSDMDNLGYKIIVRRDV